MIFFVLKAAEMEAKNMKMSSEVPHTCQLLVDTVVNNEEIVVSVMKTLK